MHPDYRDWPDGTRALSLREPADAALLARDDVQFDILSLGVGFETFEPLVPYAHCVKAVSLYGNPAADGLAQLQALEWLRDFGLKFDYRLLPRLRVFETRDASVMPAQCLNHPNIEQLDVAECRIETLAALGDMAKLRQLRLVATKTKSLDGIERLTSLRELRLHYARSLVDIAALAGCPDLRVLTFDESKKLPDLSVLRHLRQLRVLHVWQSQATLDDVDWLADLPALRHLALEAPVGRIDWASVARHPSLQNILLRVTPEGLAVSEDTVRQHFEAAGRVIKELRCITSKPGFLVRLEPRPGVEALAPSDFFPAPFVLHKLGAP